MCLLALFFRMVEDAAVVVGANREEAYARGGEPPRVLEGPCPAIAGLDRLAEPAQLYGRQAVPAGSPGAMQPARQWQPTHVHPWQERRHGVEQSHCLTIFSA